MKLDPGWANWDCTDCKHAHAGRLEAFVCTHPGCTCTAGQHTFTDERDVVSGRPLCSACRIADVDVRERCPGPQRLPEATHRIEKLAGAVVTVSTGVMALAATEEASDEA